MKKIEDFIREAIVIHGNKYDYSKVEYVNTRTKVDIICKKHGSFKQTPGIHIKYNGCPKCKNSIGEMKTENYFINNNIKYVSQYIFDGCKNKRSLKFDFYLPDYNMCIEYDGIQHYKVVKKFGGKKAFLNSKINDDIKNNFCLDNDIKLFRIKYDENHKNVLDKLFEIKSSYKETYFSKFDETIGIINNYLMNIENIEYKTLIKNIKHHYKSDNIAYNTLKNFFNNLIYNHSLIKEGGKIIIKKIT